MKWRINAMPKLEGGENIKSVIFHYVHLLLDPIIISAFGSAFLASLFWMAAMAKFELSYAYPFMSLAPAIVFILGVWLFSETFSWGKILGLCLIILGLLIMVKF
jgi:drug/metabolite transporter (DMT)-like permease